MLDNVDVTLSYEQAKAVFIAVGGDIAGLEFRAARYRAEALEADRVTVYGREVFEALAADAQAVQAEADLLRAAKARLGEALDASLRR